MPYLTQDYVNRYQRLREVCFDAFAERVERPLLHKDDFEPHPAAWRHADLFLAGFPRVRRRPGFDILCWFTQGDSNRTSKLMGYSVGEPELVPDQFDAATEFDEYCEEALVGTAETDGKILPIPAMPVAAQDGESDGWPSWLHRDINLVIEDDGTPEGIFERSQLLIWSNEPINRWHAVGYGNHQLVTEFPKYAEESMLPYTGDDAAPPPANWLPRVESALTYADIDWAKINPESEALYAGSPCKVVRFYTATNFYQQRIEEATAWISDDHWHLERRIVFAGEGGAIP